MRKEFYATKEPALGAIEGKRYLKGTKTMLIEPLPVKEVRNAVEGRPVQRRRVVKQGLRAELSVGSVPTVGLLPQLSVRRK